jgi:hypothetical protein
LLASAFSSPDLTALARENLRWHILDIRLTTHFLVVAFEFPSPCLTNSRGTFGLLPKGKIRVFNDYLVFSIAIVSSDKVCPEIPR